MGDFEVERDGMDDGMDGMMDVAEGRSCTICYGELRDDEHGVCWSCEEDMASVHDYGADEVRWEGIGFGGYEDYEPNPYDGTYSEM